METISNIYGSFTENQIKSFQKKLHKKIFWLMLYKDPQTKDKYPNVDYDKFFTFTMKEIDGLNSLLSYPEEIVELMSLLQGAYLEAQKESFVWTDYRKLILDAQNIVDKIGG